MSCLNYFSLLSGFRLIDLSLPSSEPESPNSRKAEEEKEKSRRKRKEHVPEKKFQTREEKQKLTVKCRRVRKGQKKKTRAEKSENGAGWLNNFINKEQEQVC